MNDMPKIKVVNKRAGWMGTECYINERKLEGVTSADFHVRINEVPTFNFETHGVPDIDMLADVRFSFTPETVDEAVKILRNELLKHGNVYNGFLSSMESAVREQQSMLPYRTPNWIAKDILNRMIGEG